MKNRLLKRIVADLTENEIKNNIKLEEKRNKLQAYYNDCIQKDIRRTIGVLYVFSFEYKDLEELYETFIDEDTFIQEYLSGNIDLKDIEDISNHIRSTCYTMLNLLNNIDEKTNKVRQN